MQCEGHACVCVSYMAGNVKESLRIHKDLSIGVRCAKFVCHENCCRRCCAQSTDLLLYKMWTDARY